MKEMISDRTEGEQYGTGNKNRVEDKEAVGEINRILHDYSPYIIGRMGLPYEKKQVNIISVIVDAPSDRISALSGKLGKIKGISAKVMYSKNGQ